MLCSTSHAAKSLFNCVSASIENDSSLEESESLMIESVFMVSFKLSSNKREQQLALSVFVLVLGVYMDGCHKCSKNFLHSFLIFLVLGSLIINTNKTYHFLAQYFIDDFLNFLSRYIITGAFFCYMIYWNTFIVFFYFLK